MPRKLKANPRDELTENLRAILIGQDKAIETIVPFVQMHQAGLSPEGRPIGNVLLLGPTGTGKTRTVEALAQVLHGSSKQILKVDCGEYQNGHEVAKLIGSPPGYLGHRETVAGITQKRLTEITSANCSISLVLFDEIEKAHDSVLQLLLGILDKAVLTLGSNETVNFTNSLIFLTSNLGAKAIQRSNKPQFGYESMVPGWSDAKKIEGIGLGAAKKRFAPEFVNRIDSIISYEVLGRETCVIILEQIFEDFARRIFRRGEAAFSFRVSEAAKERLLDLGTSVEFGARELKRTVYRNFEQRVSVLVSQGQIAPGATIKLDVTDGEFGIFSDTPSKKAA